MAVQATRGSRIDAGCVPSSLASVRALIISVLVATGLGLGGRESFGQRPSRPNILLLFADDQRADTIGGVGQPAHPDAEPRPARPARDELPRQLLLRLEQRGRLRPEPGHAHERAHWLDVPHDLHGVTLLPEVLREAGYETFATGKWHNGEASFVRAFPHGSSVFFGGMADHTKVPVADVRDGQVINRRVAEKFSSEQFADAAVDFLEVASGDGPFFCYVAFTAAARPAQPSGAVPGDVLPGSPAAPGELPAPPPVRQRHHQGHPRREPRPYPRTREVIGDQLCEYYGLITHLDEQVGRILEALEESGHASDTVIIYTADHGLGSAATGCSASRACTSTAWQPADHRRPRHPRRAVHRGVHVPLRPLPDDLRPRRVEADGRARRPGPPAALGGRGREGPRVRRSSRSAT